jgi:hypothetical protein
VGPEIGLGGSHHILPGRPTATANTESAKCDRSGPSAFGTRVNTDTPAVGVAWHRCLILMVGEISVGKKGDGQW